MAAHADDTRVRTSYAPSCRIRDASGLEAVGFVFVRVVDFDPDSNYQQNFNAFADSTEDLNDGSYICNLNEYSNASVQGQALRLTSDATSQRSGFTLPPQNLEKGYTATFRYRLSASGTPADGFAFNFGYPNTTRLAITGVSGFPRGLTVEWNTYSEPGLHVRVNGAQVPFDYVSKVGLADGQWHDVTVSWGYLSGLSLSTDSNIIFVNLPTPGFEPSSTDMLAFSAATGGLPEEVLIDDVVVGLNPTSVADNLLPRRTTLRDNVPNPFNPTTEIRFDLARDSDVVVEICDVSGRIVRTLTYEAMNAGFDRHVLWNGVDDRGKPVASGVYVYRLVADGLRNASKMTLIR